MFIMERNKKCLVVFLILFLVIIEGRLNAQNVEILPVNPSILSLMQTDVSVYASGGRVDQFLFRTANDNLKNLYCRSIGTGMSAEIYPSIANSLRVGCSIGYKNAKYASKKDLLTNAGVASHWVSTNIYAKCSYIGIGLESDAFLHSSIVSNNAYSYEGIYPNCFNKATLSLYANFNLSFTKISLEFRGVFDFVPPISPDKVSYHNLRRTSVQGIYWEMRLIYRIFTTGDVTDAVTIQ